MRLRRARALVTADVTHALQRPGRAVDDLGAISAAGERELIPAVARAAAAVGVDGFFIEACASCCCLGPWWCRSRWPARGRPSLAREGARLCAVVTGQLVTAAATQVHDDPDASPCDAQTQWPLHRLAELLTELAAIARASSGRTATPAAYAPGSC